MREVVTGGAGNLGTKLRLALEKADWVEEIVGIDVRPFEASGKSKSVVADLADPNDERWRAPVRAADGIVHYASANPAPTSSWAAASTTARRPPRRAGTASSTRSTTRCGRGRPLRPRGWLVSTCPPFSPSTARIPKTRAARCDTDLLLGRRGRSRCSR